MKQESRFDKFKRLLKQSTGDTALQCLDGSVAILPNEFTPQRRFRSLQDAIDNFSRHLPVEFVNPN